MNTHPATDSDYAARDFGLAAGAAYRAENPAATPVEVRTAVQDAARAAGMSTVDIQIASNVARIAAARA